MKGFGGANMKIKLFFCFVYVLYRFLYQESKLLIILILIQRSLITLILSLLAVLLIFGQLSNGCKLVIINQLIPYSRFLANFLPIYSTIIMKVQKSLSREGCASQPHKLRRDEKLFVCWEILTSKSTWDLGRNVLTAQLRSSWK